jgi:hypothetical protein
VSEWEPSKSQDWQIEGECAKKENRGAQDFFFSEDSKEKSVAKGICAACPVRKECTKWALENNMIWGIWGGKDEHQIRRTLSVNSDGAEIRRDRYPQCLNCGATTKSLEPYIAENPDGGRWTTVRLVKCNECQFVWRSRTSSNAVNAYHNIVAEKKSKKEAEAARIAKLSKDKEILDEL